MFETQNQKLLKSILCPYLNNPKSNQTCGRPYCPFKHPPETPANQNGAPAVTSTSTINKLPSNETSATTSQPITSNSQPTQQSVTLENLSSALQTVQDFIKLNSSAPNLTAQLSASLTNQLSNLTTQILSSSHTTPTTSPSTSSTSLTVKQSPKPISSFKRAQLDAPSYTPTPLVELERIKQETPLPEEPEIIEIDTYTHTKCNETNSSTKKRESDGVADTSNKKMKPETAKIDLADFAKLNAKQQMLKRYEMLKKPTPTVEELREARVKKSQSSLNSLVNTNYTAKLTAASSCEQVPKLLLDANDSSIKVPIAMRQRHLQMIFKNLTPLYVFGNADQVARACVRASEEEKGAYDRAKSKTVYVNLIANVVKKIRHEILEKTATAQHSNASYHFPITSRTLINNPTKLVNVQAPGCSSSTITHKQQVSFSHEAILSGPKATRVSYSINKVKQIEVKDLNASQLYQLFQSYALTDAQLDANSFPRWMSGGLASQAEALAHIPNFAATQHKNFDGKFSENPNSSSTAAAEAGDKYKLDHRREVKAESMTASISTKQCKRCCRSFFMNPTDLTYLSTNSECVFHWGKLRNVRFNKVVEQKYSCCGGACNSEGCEVGNHVYDGEYDGHGQGMNLTGYVMVAGSGQKTSDNIYALDCEMCYTTRGLELTRVSVIGVDMKEKYETLVKPNAQILDYNTRWSGLTKESLKNCTKSLEMVQADLIELFNKDTILIGHSLDSDFKALKMIHRNVIDTSVVFPHKMGPPIKRALRNLMFEYLQIIIQEDAIGHDSKEDALACIKLMLWKMNEDLSTKKFQSLLSSWSTSLNTSRQQISSTEQLLSLSQANTLASLSFVKKKEPLPNKAATGDKSAGKKQPAQTGGKSAFVMNKSTTQLLNSIRAFSK